MKSSDEHYMPPPACVNEPNSSRKRYSDGAREGRKIKIIPKHLILCSNASKCQIHIIFGTLFEESSFWPKGIESINYSTERGKYAYFFQKITPQNLNFANSFSQGGALFFEVFLFRSKWLKRLKSEDWMKSLQKWYQTDDARSGNRDTLGRKKVKSTNFYYAP